MTMPWGYIVFLHFKTAARLSCSRQVEQGNILCGKEVRSSREMLDDMLEEFRF